MRAIARTLAVLVFLGVVGLLGWQVYVKVTTRTDKPQRDDSAKPVAVEVQLVRRDTMRDVRTFTGTVEARSRFVVAPKIAGRLEQLKVDIGEAVSQGQLVAVLDDAEFGQEVEEARAALLVAQAMRQESRSALVVVNREYKRIETLREKKVASESDLDTARAQLEAQQAKVQVADAQVTQREAALKAAQIRQSYTRIHATWEGGPDKRVVGERFVEQGDTLSANAPIVSVLDIDTVVAVISIAERDYGRLKIDQPATLATDAYPGQTFTGRVVRLAPLFRQTSRQARVEIEAPNPDRLLKPGMFVRASIQLRQQDDATIVPIEALVKRDRRDGVFVVDRQQMRARFTPVTIGIVEADRVQIVTPQLEGLVVTLGHHLLKSGEDGSAVVLPDNAAPHAE